MPAVLWLCRVGYHSTPREGAVSHEGSQAAQVRGRTCIPASTGLPKLCHPHRVGKSKVVSGGRGKPYAAESGLFHAMFYIIRVNWFILFHRMAVRWGQKAWAARWAMLVSAPGTGWHQRVPYRCPERCWRLLRRR